MITSGLAIKLVFLVEWLHDAKEQKPLIKLRSWPLTLNLKIVSPLASPLLTDQQAKPPHANIFTYAYNMDSSSIQRLFLLIIFFISNIVGGGVFHTHC